MTAKYDHKVYGTGFALKVDPPERASDVMHYLVTGHLMCGRSLDGVKWVQSPEYNEVALRRTAELVRDMERAK